MFGPASRIQTLKINICHSPVAVEMEQKKKEKGKNEQLQRGLERLTAIR